MIRPEKTIRQQIVILEAFGDPAAVQALRWVLGELGVEEGLPNDRADWGLDPEHLDLSGIDRINKRLAERELLEASKQIAEWWLREGQQQFSGAPAAMFNLRAAIAKAEGKPNA